MKNLLIIYAIAIFSMAGILWGCMKDENVYIQSQRSFKNLSDSTTTSLHVTIPRIEWSRTKSSSGINIYVSVTDQDGNVIQEFNEHNFKLAYLCKGEPDIVDVKQHKSIATDNLKSHVAAALTMDYSGSMSGLDITNMENAVKQFIQRKDPNDYLQIIKFASTVRIMNEFSADNDVLVNAVEEWADVGGMTAYYDAIFYGLKNANEFMLDHNDLMPSVLAFTDGHENNSAIVKRVDDLIDDANQKQIPIYTIGFGNVDSGGMTRMAEETGGRYFYTPDSDGVDVIYDLISGQFDNIYGLTFEYFHIECDELTIKVEVTYENQNGVLNATASRDFLLR